MCYNLPVVADGRICARRHKECVCLDTNPPADLRLELCVNPDRICDVEIGTTDRSTIESARTNRIELYQAAQLPPGTAGWFRAPSVGVYTSGAVRYRSLPAGGIRFYRARETKP
jgi:hypothetical protein